MRIRGALVAALVVVPAVVDAQIRSSAQRAVDAAEASRRPVSVTVRNAVGIGAAVSGALLLLIEQEQPLQPMQPDGIGRNEFRAAFSSAFGRLTSDEILQYRLLSGAGVLYCEILRQCPGAVQEAIDDSFRRGLTQGADAVSSTIGRRGWRLYDGRLHGWFPWQERSPERRLLGAGLIIGGVLVAAIWPDPPVRPSVSERGEVGIDWSVRW